jgi:hypothetical protein
MSFGRNARLCAKLHRKQWRRIWQYFPLPDNQGTLSADSSLDTSEVVLKLRKIHSTKIIYIDGRRLANTWNPEDALTLQGIEVFLKG